MLPPLDNAFVEQRFQPALSDIAFTSRLLQFFASVDMRCNVEII